MSAEATPAPAQAAFAGRAILVMVLVSVVAFAGLAVLAAYAPDLRSPDDGRTHALSKSAIGFAGAPILLKGMGVPAIVSRTRPTRASPALVVLTPDRSSDGDDLRAYPKGRLTLIVLPKWQVTRDPLRKGAVRKIGVIPTGSSDEILLKSYADDSRLRHRKGWSQPTLHGAGGPFLGAGTLRLGRIDRLQTLSGEGWIPALADEQGNAVLAISRKTPSIWVLADPDLLNNQGLASRENARAFAAIIEAARAGDRPVVFDVTLNGFARGKGLGRLLLEPPWLAATLCGVAATLLMGLHALARFGQPRRQERPFALGAGALVDNSAGLVRMARKEHELAPAYAALMQARLGADGAGHDPGWLEEMARRRGVQSPAALAAESEGVKTRGDLLEVARKLYHWKTEMTRGRG